MSRKKLVYCSMSQIWTCYKESIPTGHYYYGRTEKIEEGRHKKHINELKEGTHANPFFQKWYDEGGNIEDLKYEEIKTGDEYTIRCEEHFKVKEHISDPMCLNIKVPYPPKIQKIKMEQGYEQAKKEYNRYYDSTWWNKTPLGKLTERVDNARLYIKHHTKRENWKKVDWWNKELEKRLIARQEYKNSEEYKEYKLSRRKQVTI